jgi:signal transduction histidine kinase
LSLLCIVGISAASAFLLDRFLTENMLMRDAQVSMQFVESIVQAEGTSAYFLDRDFADANPVLESFFKYISLMPDVVRANVYANDRAIIWSSTRALMGKRFGPNPELEEAFEGNLEIESGTVGSEDDKTEHIELDPDKVGFAFVETYIPIWSEDRQTVVGVVEIYRLPSALFAAIRDGQRLVWLSALAGGLLIYATLFWIVRRANKLIVSQQKKLVDAETMAATGELASAVAHSIRNALASIRSSAEVALEDEPAVAREAANDIMNETDRLDKWVRDLLRYARSEPGLSEEVWVRDAVDTCLQGLESTMTQQHVNLDVEVAADLPAVKVDSAPIEQVLNSLITNALEAMPNGGRLSIRGKLDRGRDIVELRIADTGHGISREAAAQVFRPYFTTKRSGLGLGLALSRRIIERYGGTLRLESVENQGATVTMRLPAAA